jgi:hypothetical protein
VTHPFLRVVHQHIAHHSNGSSGFSWSKRGAIGLALVK